MTDTSVHPAPERVEQFIGTVIGDLGATVSSALTHIGRRLGLYRAMAGAGPITAADLDLAYWADPGRNEQGVVNEWDDGRGIYFDDPNGHLLEIITRPYGSGGTDAEHPHPLLAPTIEPDS